MEPPSIRDLYPDLTNEESEQAQHNLDQYLLLVLRIFERLEREKSEKDHLP